MDNKGNISEKYTMNIYVLTIIKLYIWKALARHKRLMILWPEADQFKLKWKASKYYYF